MKITPEIIKEVTNRLVKTYKPLEIYLFGSYAWGQPTAESDLDLLVVVEKADAKNFWLSNSGDEALFGLKIPRDILVYSKIDFEQKSQDTTSLEYKIKKNGQILYASV
jgi:predicted nucleotidyltransferase